MQRYVIERVAKQPDLRRIKDTERGRYLRQPHGSEYWPSQMAAEKIKNLNPVYNH